MKPCLKTKLSRRELIGAASAVTIGATMLPSAEASRQGTNYQVGKNPGKREPLPDFKFDIEATKGWVGEEKLPWRSFALRKALPASPCV